MTAPAVRAFIALELPAEARARLFAGAAELRAHAEGVRWVEEKNLHLTLRFLGQSSPETIATVAERLAAACAACPAVEAPLRGLGTFPPGGRPRVLWIGLEVPEPIFTLQRACEAAAVAAGFAPETKPFVSHLTLGRWKQPGRRPRLPPLDLGPVHLDAVVLQRSVLGPQGPTYTPLHTFTLSG